MKCLKLSQCWRRISVAADSGAPDRIEALQPGAVQASGSGRSPGRDASQSGDEPSTEVASRTTGRDSPLSTAASLPSSRRKTVAGSAARLRA